MCEEYQQQVLSDEVIPEPAGLLGAIDYLDRQRVCLLAWLLDAFAGRQGHGEYVTQAEVL